jgi:hypothetical protein
LVAVSFLAAASFFAAGFCCVLTILFNAV